VRHPPTSVCQRVAWTPARATVASTGLSLDDGKNHVIRLSVLPSGSTQRNRRVAARRVPQIATIQRLQGFSKHRRDPETGLTVVRGMTVERRVVCLSRKGGDTPETIVCSSGRSGTGGRETISKPSPGLGDSITGRFAKRPAGPLRAGVRLVFRRGTDEVARARAQQSHCIPKGKRPRRRALSGSGVDGDQPPHRRAPSPRHSDADPERDDQGPALRSAYGTPQSATNGKNAAFEPRCKRVAWKERTNPLALPAQRHRAPQPSPALTQPPGRCWASSASHRLSSPWGAAEKLPP
jgi:hypothetical protein